MAASEQWEYDHLEEPPRRMRQLMDDLNDMGRDGWEAFAALSMGGAFGGAAMPNLVVFVKRRIA